MCPGRIAVEAAQLAGTAFGELVPPEAQVHLLNAQRELITALMLIYENRVSPAQAPRGRVRRATSRRRTTRRDRKIPIE